MDEVSPNILAKVRAKVEDCYRIAEKHFNTIFPRCEVKFTLTGTKAGTADYTNKVLQFNRKLLIENEEHFFKDTIIHKCCHIFDIHLNYFSPDWTPHGNSWKKCMIEVFHTPPKRCHKLSVESVKRKTKEYVYHCKCPGKVFTVGLIKHKKIKKGNLCYCPKCRGVLEYEGKGTSKIVNKKLTSEELN